MAHVAGPNAYRFAMTPDTITFGQFKVPIGKATNLHVYEKDYKGNTQNMVRIWTIGGMGMGGKEVLLDFRCLTREKLASFVQSLLKTVGPSFSFYATAIRPSNPAQKPGEEVHVETVEIQFQEEHYAQEFQDMMAPVFFPGFKTSLAGRVLTLAIEGSEQQVVQAARQAFDALGKHTFGQSNELLWKAGHPLFQGAPPKRDAAACCAPCIRTAHYAIAPTQVTKEEAHFDEPPEDFDGYVDRGVWYRQEPLKAPTDEELVQMRGGKEEILGGLRKACELFPSQKNLLAPTIAELELRFNQGQPRNAFEAEVMYNLIHNMPQPDESAFSQEERALLEQMKKEEDDKAASST